MQDSHSDILQKQDGFIQGGMTPRGRERYMSFRSEE